MALKKVEKVYQSLSPSDFSRDILAKATTNLAALPVTDLEWSDLGEPRRVHWVRRKLGRDIEQYETIKEKLNFRGEASSTSGSTVRGGEAPFGGALQSKCLLLR